MALTALGGYLTLPAMPFAGPAVPPTRNAAMTMNAAGGRYAWVLQAPKTGTLNRAEIDFFSVVTAETVKLSFQGVNAAGDPDGVISAFRTGTPATGWFQPGLMTSDGTDVGTKLTVTRGQWLAVVLEFDSAIGDVRPCGITEPTNVWNAYNLAYADEFDGVSWSKDSTTPVLVLQYSDGTYVTAPAFWVLSAFNSVTFNSGSTPDERALIYTPPVPVRVGGAWVLIDLDAACDLVLYGPDGTSVLGSCALDPDYRVVPTGKIAAALFASAVDLAAGSAYRLAVKPTSGSSVTVYDIDVNAAAILGALSGGTAASFSGRTDAGAWSPTTTKRPMLGFLVEGFEAGGGDAAVVPTGWMGQYPTVIRGGGR